MNDVSQNSVADGVFEVVNAFRNKVTLHAVQDVISKLKAEGAEVGELGDGYHSFNELYKFRKLYNAALFNEWAKKDLYDVHKSTKHHDGSLCFGGGWFVVVAKLPTGQISNHYPLSDWNLFDVNQVPKVKYEFDGHTSSDVMNRLNAYLNGFPQNAMDQA